MSKLKLYFRLALQSQRRNRQFYLPFLLTSAGCAGIFYIMRFLCYSGIDEKVEGGAYLGVILGLGCIVIAYTALAILCYANKFVMRRRQKELGLYNILGMQKSDISVVLTIETVLLALESILGGWAFGILFSKLALLLLLKLVHMDAPFGFSICVPGLIQTAILFAIIFVVLLIYNIRSVLRTSPVELLHSTNTGEREPKSNWIGALFGALSLCGGYAIAIFTKNPISALMLFFVAVTLVIIGTYLLFSSISVVILKALRRRKNFYYKPQNFTAVSGMLYRMKQNARGLSNICILATMVLVTVSCTVCMYSGSQDGLERLYPEQIALHYICPAETVETEDFTQLDTAVSAAAQSAGATADQVKSHLRVAFGVGQMPDGSFTLDTGKENETITTAVLDFITAEDYARLTGEPVRLGKGDVLACGLPDGQQTVTIGTLAFNVKEQLDTFPVPCDSFAYQLANVVYFVVSDRSVLSSIYQMQNEAYGSQGSSLVYTIAADPVLDDDAMLACRDAMQNAGDAALASSGSGLVFSSQSCRTDARDDFYLAYGGFLFLGLFLGALFLLATVLIIYYKQLSEGYEDRDRFVSLQKVGMSEHEVRSSIQRQVLMIFFLPLIVAALHIFFAFPMIVRLFTLFSLDNVPLFAVCTLITLLVFSGVYVVVYLLTARKYYRIVRS